MQALKAGASRAPSAGAARPRATAPPSPPAPPRAGPAPAPAARALASLASAALLLLSAPSPPALAFGDGDREKLGEFAASGIVFKDSVEITALSDRDLPGATVYLSDFKRSLSDKLSKDFFNEPSQASLSCALEQRAAAALASEPTPALSKRLGGSGGAGAEVFAERKGLNLFRDKTLRVRRIFDGDRRTAVYVAYSTRLGTAGDEGAVSTGRYRTSICVVPLPAYAEAPAVAAEAAAAATAAR